MRLSMLFVLVFAAACGSSGTPKELAELADRACACKPEDVACGTKVLAALRSYTNDNKADVSEAVTKTGTRIYDCLRSTGVVPTEVATVLGKAVR